MLKEPSGADWEFEGFKVMKELRLLTAGGTPVPLTSKAFDTLVVLIENSDRVVKKDELLRSVWPDVDVEEGNLTQQIFLLRKALGETAQQPRCIVTVPGHGYRFTAHLNAIAADSAGTTVSTDGATSPPAAPRRGATFSNYAGIALLALMAVGGMLSSVAYNAALGRAAYQSDTFFQQFGWGAQALFLPFILTCLAAGLAGAAIAVRRVVIEASAGARELDRRLWQRGRNLCVRLALTDPAVCTSWLLLVTALCAAMIWTYWTPLLMAVTTDISFAPAETLAVFSPALAPYRTGYRMALSLLVAGNLAGWFIVARATGRQAPLPDWIVATEVALIALLLISMQLPYRLLHHVEKSDAVTWRGQQCYVVGKGPTDDLLYCSRMFPRIHVVPRTAVPLPPSRPKVHPFAPFSPAGL